MSTSSPWSAPGFAGSVAPLGTALTENQLALLWKMADEPILCFDGDKAGQKAAWRAADLALPHLQPGKSLRFALLPEGQDPDDLARSGGRAAIEEVIAAARGLADVIWSREIEGGTFATPERRAALESADRRTYPTASATKWCGAIIARIWPSGCSARSRRKAAAAAMAAAIFAAASGGNSGRESGRAFAPRGSFTPGAAGRFEPRFGRAQGSAGSQTINRGPYQAASPQLATARSCAASAARSPAARR